MAISRHRDIVEVFRIVNQKMEQYGKAVVNLK